MKKSEIFWNIVLISLIIVLFYTIGIEFIANFLLVNSFLFIFCFMMYIDRNKIPSLLPFSIVSFTGLIALLILSIYKLVAKINKCIDKN